MITRSVACFKAKDLQPYSVVGNAGFCHMLKTIEPQFKLPTRATFTDSALPSLYKETKAKEMESKCKASRVAITSDAWTSVAIGRLYHMCCRREEFIKATLVHRNASSAASLCSSPEIRGIFRSGKEHKSLLHADDLFFCITDSQNILAYIITTLDCFTKFPGYKINVLKSELFPVNSATQSLSFNS